MAGSLRSSWEQALHISPKGDFLIEVSQDRSYAQDPSCAIDSRITQDSRVADGAVPSVLVPESSVCGSVLVLIQYDVCEEIKLETLRRIIGAPTSEPAKKTAAPERIRFVNPPVVERLENPRVEGNEPVDGQIKYYDYGVVSVIFELSFGGKWQSLVELASRWMWDTDIERYTSDTVKRKLTQASEAFIKPYADWLTEDYLIVQVREAPGAAASSELLSQFGQQIAQIVRGEIVPLSESEYSEVLQSHISYYRNDLAVIGWNSAFVYDTTVGAQTARELLEYANSQLLEFRHYDELLSRELQGAYRLLEKGTGTMARWRLAREATRLQAVLLEVTELTERADNAIKFLGDMFSARLYRLAAGKIGVQDYKNLVNQKLRTAQDLYRFMVDQFYQSRAFVLEAVMVVILVIELIYLFHGQAGF